MPGYPPPSTSSVTTLAWVDPGMIEQNRVFQTACLSRLDPSFFPQNLMKPIFDRCAALP